MSEDFIDNVNEKKLDQQVVVGLNKHQMVVSWLDKHWTKVQKTNLVKNIQVTLFSKQKKQKNDSDQKMLVLTQPHERLRDLNTRQ